MGISVFNLIFKKLEEMDEDLEKCVTETIPVVSSVRFHTGYKTHKTDFYVNLRCCAVFSL